MGGGLEVSGGKKILILVQVKCNMKQLLIQ